VSEPNSDINSCIDYLDILTICIGDKIEITVRGQRAIISYRGVVKALSNTGILLETRNSLVAIRLSDINRIRKLQQK